MSRRKRSHSSGTSSGFSSALDLYELLMKPIARPTSHLANCKTIPPSHHPLAPTARSSRPFQRTANANLHAARRKPLTGILDDASVNKRFQHAFVLRVVLDKDLVMTKLYVWQVDRGDRNQLAGLGMDQLDGDSAVALSVEAVFQAARPLLVLHDRVHVLTLLADAGPGTPPFPSLTRVFSPPPGCGGWAQRVEANV